MERIGKGGSGIRGNVFGVSYSSDTHLPKGSDDLIDICFQVRADRVEAVKTGFGLNRLLV